MEDNGQRRLSILSDIELVKCVMIGDDESGIQMMMKKYAQYVGVPYGEQDAELITAFNGRKCIFRAAPARDFEDPHVFLLCVSVARQASAEETVRMILDTVIERIRGIPFVLVGTQIDKRLSMLIENYGSGQIKYLPMPLNQAESFAKRIGASKYLECSEITGEGLDEVFEEAFSVGYNYALEQLRGYRRKMSEANMPKERKISCITQ
ncbi:Ras family protein [Necator americanus]|uniref:Ras family protein n=1 Tax=Necator americanus TaxID=51031 RepID=W2TBZ4_NECAM|nr:Ras family protein [Necator americanus]ETN78522.1 Ras family protein [Necator americanus]